MILLLPDIRIMKNIKIFRSRFYTWCMVLLLAFGLAACQSENDTSPMEEGTTSSQVEQDASDQEDQAASAGEPNEESQGDAAVVPTSMPEDSESDPAAIEAAWRSSPHAKAFVVDAAGQNNSCAQCHAPLNWQPSMDTLPESCFVCKFELEDPPPFIPEASWDHVPCKICHRIDRDDNVQPEIAWLEIPVLEEYADVSSPTELCLKCHTPVDVPQHGNVELVSAHADYQCTDCHQAHQATATCVSEACHSDVIEPVEPIPGHDADHQSVLCVACHDGSGMQVGPDEGSGLWTTFAVSGSEESGLDRFTFTSHDIVLESNCNRCHYADNPWGLSVEVLEP